METVFNVSGDFDTLIEPIDTFYVTSDLYENVPTNYIVTVRLERDTMSLDVLIICLLPVIL